VELRKPPGSRLGVDVALLGSPLGYGIVVERVGEGGVVEAWNRRNHEPLRIRPGDFIVRCNGIEGDLAALASELRSGKDVRITVQRHSVEESPQVWQSLAARKQRAGLADARQAESALVAQQTLALNSAVGSMARVNPVYPTQGGTNMGQGGACHAGQVNTNAASQQWWAAQNQAMNGGPLEATNASEASGRFTFEVLLQKPDGSHLGIDVLPGTEFGGLSVKRVSKGGVVETWNTYCREAFTIRPGDHIIRVNGITAEVAAMME
ncbi:unnamed protein product, partial [Polarella glacialis]